MIEQAVGAEIAFDRAIRGSAPRPAPLTPEAASTMIPSRSTRPASTSGFSASVGGGRIAAGSGDALGTGELGAVEFGKAVDEAAEQVGPRVRLAVPALILGGAVEPEVGAEVDERCAGGEQIVGQPLGFAMGQSGENQIATVEQSRVPCLEGQVGISEGEVRMDRGDRLAGARRAERHADLHRRMAGDKAHQFAADITGGAKDRDTNHALYMQLTAYLCNML